MPGAAEDDTVTVSVVVRDGRGFTYYYEDFVTSSENAQHALRTLAPHQESTQAERPRMTSNSASLEDALRTLAVRQ